MASPSRLKFFLSHLLAAVLAFHVGFVRQVMIQPAADCGGEQGGKEDVMVDVESLMRMTVTTGNTADDVQNPTTTRSSSKLSLLSFFGGASRVNRDAFAQVFDIGFPLHKSSPRNSDVLLLHTTTTTTTTTTSMTSTTRRSSNNVQNASSFSAMKPLISSDMPRVSLDQAINDCQVVKVLVVAEARKKDRNADTCHALVFVGGRGIGTGHGRSAGNSNITTSSQSLQQQQHQASYHISKWVRRKPQPPKADNKNNKKKTLKTATLAQEKTIPLTPASRYAFPDKATQSAMLARLQQHMQPSYQELSSYLGVLEDVLNELAPIAAQVAKNANAAIGKQIPNPKGVIIVMTCNWGHAEMFLNFVCAARSVGMDLSQVLLFATDRETHELAESLGVAAFYNPILSASIPKDASTTYGDAKYARVMMSKVYCVHLVSLLGYDILFEDVDIVPYSAQQLEFYVERAYHHGTTAAATKNNNTKQQQQQQEPDFDLLFQNDFNPRADYAPWVANSGCYYAKNNARTKYFFHSMLLQGDSVLKARSHQEVMHTLLSEHASLYGLRIKNLDADNELLPMGWHYQRNPKFMKEMIKSGKKGPVSFHMNWNTNKKDKRLYLEQMGDWYVQDACMGQKTVADIIRHSSTTSSHNNNASIMTTCCAASPFVRCHFRDKPSVIPCKDSPPFRKGQKSFW